MPVYFAGTAETSGLETILISLAVFFAVLTMLSWGIPYFRDLLRQRREDRERALMEQEAEQHLQDDSEDVHWHSQPAN